MSRSSANRSEPLRGQVYVRSGDGAMPVVVISNDFRNKALSSVLVATITTAPKPDVPTIVELPIGEPAIGRVLCDDILPMDKADMGKVVGTLSRRAMSAVDEALRLALALETSSGKFTV